MARAHIRLGRPALPVSAWLGAIAALLVAGLLTLQGPAAAFATTGPSLLEPPTYQVPLRQAKPFCGHYALQHADAAAHFTGGLLAITLNSQGVLTGMLQVYGRDTLHYATTWVATLYNFHVLAKRRMAADLFGAGYSVRLGRLVLTRTATGDLAGQLSLGAQGYTVVWHRLAAPQGSIRRTSAVAHGRLGIRD
jgi:hypothetical protein